MRKTPPTGTHVPETKITDTRRGPVPACPHCGAPGPFYHRLEVLSRIEVTFSEDGSHRIAPDVEAEELRAGDEGYECGSCGRLFTSPVMGQRSDEHSS